MTKTSEPVQLAERVTPARIESVIELVQAKQAQPSTEPTKFDQARIAKWIRDRLTAAWPGGCWHCRRPFTFGQKFIDIRGNEVVVRFHARCESEWRRAQETLARRALGLEA